MSKANLPYLFIASWILMALLAVSCSSNEEDKTPIPLEGLWKITEVIKLETPIEEEPAEEDPAEEDPAGEDDNNEEGGTSGAPSLKNGETGEAYPDLTDGAYLNLTSTTYSYFTLTEGLEEGWSSGTYLRTGNELAFTEANENTIQAQILELKSDRLRLEMTFEEGREEWIMDRIPQNPLPGEEEEEEEDSYVDYEAEYHDPQAVEGSLLNAHPLNEVLNQTLEGVLNYVDETSNPPLAETYYFLKVDPADTYRLTLTVTEAVYNHDNLPSSFMRYVQLWTGTQPFEESFKADSQRISEGQEGEPIVVEGLKSATGFLYFRVFSLQDGISYRILLEKEAPAEEEQTNEEEESPGTEE